MLKQRIQDDMKAAMKGGDKPRLGVIRLLMAAIKQREVDERIELDDSAIISVIDRMLKQRRDSISQFAAAGRDELADAERFESELLSSYLPAGLSADEVSAAIAQAIADANAAGPGDMGRVMNKLRGGLAGRADMGEVSRLVKMRLAGA